MKRSNPRQTGCRKKAIRGWELDFDIEDEKFMECVKEAYKDCFHDDDICDLEWKSWVCTRLKGHKGPHVAGGLHSRSVYGMWGMYTKEEWKLVLVAAKLGVGVDI